MVNEGGVIVGRIDSDNDGSVNDGDAGDVAAFAISIEQDGFVSLAQYLSLTNPIFPNDFDETVDLSGKVNAVVTVTDGDLDTDSNSVGIGSQLFFSDDLVVRAIDDVPTAANDTDAVDAVVADEAIGNVIMGVSENGVGGPDTAGADGATVTAIFSKNESDAGTVGALLSGEFGDLTRTRTVHTPTCGQRRSSTAATATHWTAKPAPICYWVAAVTTYWSAAAAMIYYQVAAITIP